MDYHYQDIKIIKRKGDQVICFRFIENNTYYFGKLVHLDMQIEFIRERDINIYINNNIKNSKYYTKMLNVYENITIPDSLSLLLKDPNIKYNLMIFDYSVNYPLRYYINKLSSKKFNEIIKQIREATELLNDIGVIHYDLYCESNVMLKKENNKWIIKIIDYGLSYIDLTDKTDSDYNNVIESIEHFNKKHSL